MGRERERAILASRLDDLLTHGTGALVLIGGEPGIGKTTLLEFLERQARQRDVTVLSARSPAATGAPAFWLWSQLIESLATDLDDAGLRVATRGAARPVAQLSTTVAERTGQATPMLGDDPQALRFLLYDAVATFLRHVAAAGPVVVTLDDIHWADPPSLELLSYLTPGLATQPLLVVAAYRDLPTEATDALAATLAAVSREDVAHELALTGLSATDVGELVATLPAGTPPSSRGMAEVGAAGEARTAGSGDRSFAELLHERTGGNPFFVRQLARLLHEQGDPATPEGMDPLSAPAPPGVRHVIAQRLTALTEPAQQFLAAAAIVGRDFDLRTAAHAVGMDPGTALDAYDEAARHGLVEACPVRPAPTGPGKSRDRRFVHALVQEVALDMLPSGRAARMHAAVGTVLERDGAVDHDELARHLWAARDIVGTAAVPSLVAAAHSAAAVYALDQAETHLRRALELVRADPRPDPSRELSLLLGLFRLIVTGRGWGHVDVRAVMDRAMELAEAGAYNDETSRLWWTLFFFLLDRGDESYLDVAATLWEAVEGDGPGRATAHHVDTRARIGQASRAVAHLTNVFGALDAEDRDLARTHLLDARRAVEAAPAADLAAFDEHLHVMQLVIEATWATLTNDRDGYRALTSAAVALADADGRPFPRAVARTLAAVIGAYISDVEFVADLAHDALELDERFRFGWLAAVAEYTHVWARAHLDGPTTETVEILEARLSDVIAVGRLGNEGIMSILLGDVYALQGRVQEARRVLERARANPGPYRGLVVDLIDVRLQRLPQVIAAEADHGR